MSDLLIIPGMAMGVEVVRDTTGKQDSAKSFSLIIPRTAMCEIVFRDSTPLFNLAIW